MKVLHLARRFVRHSWGGAETVILETARCLMARGHETSILCPNALSDLDEEVVGGVPVRRVPYFYPYLGLKEDARWRLDRVGGNMFSFALMRELSREPGLDLLHLHTGKRIGGIGRHVARRRGIPYVVTLHGGKFDVPDAERAAWTEPTKGALEWGKVLGWWVGSRRVLRDAQAVICVGLAEAEEVRRRLPDAHVVHLPNGVDAERFARGEGAAFRQAHGIPADARVVLTVARLDPQKNQAMGVRLAGRLRAEGTPAHLVLVGPPTDEAYVERLRGDVRAEGLGEAVTIVPGLEASSGELVDAYHAADAFLLPSVHEPFGIVVLEAWAAGLPVVASRVGGIPSFVEHERNGLLFDSDDDEEALAGLRRVLQDADLARRLAEQGRNLARETYGWESLTDRLIQIYEDARRRIR